MKIITPLPTEITLACSGGIDSMFALHFFNKSKRKVNCIFFNHGTETSNLAEQFLINAGLNPTIGRIQTEKPKELSVEEHWRIERYAFFRSFPNVVTCHHLDDVVETWVMSGCFGQPKTIPYRNKNVIRPFLYVKKSEIESYCRRHGVTYIQDETNYDVKYSRNRIRHNVIPELLKVNPGLYKTVSKQLDNGKIPK